MHSAKSADRTVKSIYPYLADKCSAQRLRKLYWSTFQNHDRPVTSDPVTMAFHAFYYLSINDDGDWNHGKDILSAIFSYLREFTGTSANQRQAHKLAELLKQQPVQKELIQEWFDVTYR